MNSEESYFLRGCHLRWTIKIVVGLLAVLFIPTIHAQTCTPGGGVLCTPHYNLFLPPYGYPNWNTVTNANWSSVDSLVAPLPVFVSVIPSGACPRNGAVEYYTGQVPYLQYTCNLVWRQVGSSGSFTALTGDAISTSTGGATEVVGLLNNLLPPLATGYLNWTGTAWAFSTGGGAVSSVANSDGTLTISPTTGSVVASLALTHANTWSANQTAAKWIASTGFDISGATTAGHYLRNNGTDYVDNSIQVADVPTLNQNTTGNAATATAATNMSGGGVGSAPYQSAANTSAFIASPTTSGHTFVYAWQPSGSAVTPAAFDITSYLASGTVTSFSAGNLSPLFTTSVATATTTPALSFSLSSAAQNSVFAGPATGGSGAPSYRALVSLDIPNNAANTSGTAANLSGTPALPNGTTATTQTTGDNSTKLATDAFVIASALTNPMTTLGDIIYENSTPTAARLAGPTSGTVPYDLCSTPSSSLAQAPAWCLPGIAGRTVTGTTDTIAATDRGTSILYNSASAVAVTLTSAATLGNNFDFAVVNENAGTVTLTAGAGNIYPGGSTTLAVTEGQNCAFSSPDNVNYVARCSPGQVVAGSGVTATASATGTSIATNAQYRTWACEPGLGDGLNAVPSGTYLQTECLNTSGVTWTITGIKCFSDNNGSSTLNATDGSANALLTGAISCSNSFAAGTLGSTTTIAANGYVKFTFVADGVSKQSTFVIYGTY